MPSCTAVPPPHADYCVGFGFFRMYAISSDDCESFLLTTLFLFCHVLLPSACQSSSGSLHSSMLIICLDGLLQFVCTSTFCSVFLSLASCFLQLVCGVITLLCNCRLTMSHSFVPCQHVCSVAGHWLHGILIILWWLPAGSM